MFRKCKRRSRLRRGCTSSGRSTVTNGESAWCKRTIDVNPDDCATCAGEERVLKNHGGDSDARKTRRAQRREDKGFRFSVFGFRCSVQSSLCPFAPLPLYTPALFRRAFRGAPVANLSDFRGARGSPWGGRKCCTIRRDARRRCCIIEDRGLRGEGCFWWLFDAEDLGENRTAGIGHPVEARRESDNAWALAQGCRLPRVKHW